MIKRFIRDTGIYGISNLISKGVSILLVPFYTRVLTPSDYGIIDIIAVFYAIVAVTVPLEITQAVAIFLSENNNDSNNDNNINNDKNNSNKVVVSSTALILTIVTVTVFLIISLLFSNTLAGVLLDDKTKSDIFRVASFHMFFTSLFYFVQNQLRWLLRPVKVAIVSITFTVLSILLTIYFVLFLKYGVIGVFWSYVISGFISFLLGYYFSRDCFRFKFSFLKLREMLKFSLPLVPSGVGGFFLNYTQRILIKGMMTLGDLGLFGVASRLSSFINLAFQSIQGALIPLIYQRSKEKSTPESLRKLFNYLSFILLVCLISVSLFAKNILIILTTPAYYSAYFLVPFLFISEIFEGMKSFAPGLAIKKKTKIIAVINIIAGILTVGLSLLLIYYFGLLGAAISICLKSIIVFIFQMYYSQREYYVPYNFLKNSFGFLLGVLIIILISFMDGKEFLIILKVFAILSYSLILIYIIKLINIKDLSIFIKSLYRTR